MAIAQILATANTAANSADVVITSSLTVGLKGLVAGGTPARVFISLKDDAGAYNIVGELNIFDKAVCITAPGTYRFARQAGGTCGVFSA